MPSELSESTHGCFVVAYPMGVSVGYILIDSDVTGAWKKLRTRNWSSL